MSDNGVFTAIERIERALARIEAASVRQTHAANNDLALAELTARHRTLRAETQKTLVELDLLLAGTK